MDNSRYRPCAGICLKNKDGLLFAGRRFGYAKATWQLPQGGIDAGEDPEAAAFRELHEETGVTSAKLIMRTSDWLYYDLPTDLGGIWKGRYKGQRQLWFLFEFEGSEDEIDISGLGGEKPEFSDWAWKPMEEIKAQIVPFKRDVYEAVAKSFQKHLA